VDGNSDYEWLDTIGNRLAQDTATLPSIFSTASAWMRYNEETGLWEDPIIDFGGTDNQPNGRVLDLRPKIQFTEFDDPDTLRSEYAYDVWHFFGKELDEETFKQYYRSLFVTRRLFMCKVRGIDWAVGDPVWFTKLKEFTKYGVMVVKKASINILEEETELEVYA
jgi:hypothetical protein